MNTLPPPPAHQWPSKTTYTSNEEGMQMSSIENCSTTNVIEGEAVAERLNACNKK